MVNPHKAAVIQMRINGASYDEISAWLTEQAADPVSPRTIRRWVEAGPAVDELPDAVAQDLDAEGYVRVPTRRPDDPVRFRSGDDLLQWAGLDPKRYELKKVNGRESFKLSARGEFEVPSTDGWLKLDVEERVHSDDDLEALTDRILRRVGPPTKLKSKRGARKATYVLAVADWQLGKGEGGGTPETVAAIKSQIESHMLRIARGDYEAVNLKGLGDIVEGCIGFYPNQSFSVDLTGRQQRELAVELLVWVVSQLVTLGLPVYVDAVPGNHGEFRHGGKNITNTFDNSDLEVFTYAKAICERDRAFRHVTWAIDDRMWRIVEHSGILIGSQHGHLASKGQGPAGKMESFWDSRDRDIARQFRGAVDLTFQGHYHHYLTVENKMTTHVQVPGNDPGSDWFQDLTGSHSPRGMLGIGVGLDYGIRKWGDLFIA